jgi:hypothetical protein
VAGNGIDKPSGQVVEVHEQPKKPIPQEENRPTQAGPPEIAAKPAEGGQASTD